MHCVVLWSGFVPTDMPKPIAIVVAMPLEVAPLVRSLPKRDVEGMALFQLPGAVVVVGGIGERSARKASRKS